MMQFSSHPVRKWLDRSEEDEEREAWGRSIFLEALATLVFLNILGWALIIYVIRFFFI